MAATHQDAKKVIDIRRRLPHPLNLQQPGSLFMPRTKRLKQPEVTAVTPEHQSEQMPEQQGELAAESEVASTVERPPYRVFAHDNLTGLKYIEDYERRSVALSFADKPAEETIAKLRESPFKWNAEAKAWLAPANYVNRDAGQKLFREIAGIQLEGPTRF